MLTLVSCLSAATIVAPVVEKCIRSYLSLILPYMWAYQSFVTSTIAKSNRGPIALLATSEQNTSCSMFMARARALTLKINEWFRN